MKKVEIEWIDSKSGGDWEYLNEIQFSPARIITIGFVLDENDESITVAHSITKNQCCGRITIPKVCIKNRKDRPDGINT